MASLELDCLEKRLERLENALLGDKWDAGYQQGTEEVITVKFMSNNKTVFLMFIIS